MADSSKPSNGNVNTEARFARIDGKFEAVDARLDGLTATVESLSTTVGQGFARLEAVVTQQHVASRPTWQMVGAAVGFLMLVGGPVATALTWYVTAQISAEREARSHADEIASLREWAYMRMIDDRLRFQRDALTTVASEVPEHSPMPEFRSP